MQLTRKELEETQMIVTTPEKWDVVTRKAFPLTNMGGCMKPTWSADGKSLYFTKLTERDEDLWVATNLGLATRR